MAALIIVVAGLREAADPVVVPFLLSMLLAALGIPPMAWLRGRGLPAPLAILTVVLGLVVVLIGLGAIVGSSYSAFSDALPRYQMRLNTVLESFDAEIASRDIDFSLASIADDVADPGQAFQLAGRLLSSLAGFLSSFALVFLTMIFIMMEAAGFPAKVRAAFGGHPTRLAEFSHVLTQIYHYLMIKSAISLATGLILGCGLSGPLGSSRIPAQLHPEHWLDHGGGASGTGRADPARRRGDARPPGDRGLRHGQHRPGKLHRTLADGPKAGAVDAGRVRFAGVLGMGARAGGNVVVGSADDGLQDFPSEQ
jgi:hypothetical protein